MSLHPAADVPLLVASPSTQSERRISPSWSVAHLKTRLEPVTGIPASSQKLSLRIGSQAPVPLEAANEEATRLSEFPLQPYAEIYVSPDLSSSSSRSLGSSLNHICSYPILATLASLTRWRCPVCFSCHCLPRAFCVAQRKTGHLPQAMIDVITRSTAADLKITVSTSPLVSHRCRYRPPRPQLRFQALQRKKRRDIAYSEWGVRPPRIPLMRRLFLHKPAKSGSACLGF